MIIQVRNDSDTNNSTLNQTSSFEKNIILCSLCWCILVRPCVEKSRWQQHTHWISTLYAQYIVIGQLNLSYHLAMVHSIPSWLVWEEIECTVHIAPPNRPINQFELVQQSRQQVLRAYCPNMIVLYVLKARAMQLMLKARKKALLFLIFCCERIELSSSFYFYSTCTRCWL